MGLSERSDATYAFRFFWTPDFLKQFLYPLQEEKLIAHKNTGYFGLC